MCDMALMFRNGDYVSDGAAGLSRVTGREALLQRVLFRLTARRGTFPFCGTLGSRLWQLGQLPAHARQTAARQYVTEALAEERSVSVESVTLTEKDGGATLFAQLSCAGELLPVTVEIRM